MVTPLFRISGVGSPFFNNYYAFALLDESRIVSDVFDLILQTSRNIFIISTSCDNFI